MEVDKGFVLLPPDGIAILRESRSAFCRALEGKFGCTAEIHNVEDHAASSFAHIKATIVPEIKYSKQLSKSVKVSVWKDDLTTHKSDAVVNAANEYLSHGAGLALALCRAGGPQIKKCSDDVIKYKGKVPTGEAVVTPSGNLPCKIIIHAVGPCVSQNATKSELEKASQLLHKTIWNILKTAVSENMVSVAIPAISSGLFNFPLARCAEIIVNVVKEFRDKRQSRSLEIRLVNNDDPSVHQMQKACCEILGQSDQMPAQSSGSAPTQSLLSSLDLGNVNLHLRTGAIEDQTTDVIVNTIGNDLDLSRGQVSAALLRKAGYKLQEDIKRHGYGSDGDVIPTPGHYLNCKAVFHTVCGSGYNAKKIIDSGVAECLRKATAKGYSSISFPALGTGNLRLEKDEVSKIMTNAARQFSRTYQGSKINIYFVIFPKDTETLKAFEKTMASTKAGKQTSPISSSANGKSSGLHDGQDVRTQPSVELFSLSHEALREAKRWSYDMLHLSSVFPTIYNNHVAHLSQEDHKKLMFLQEKFNVSIKEFYKQGKGGIIIKGDDLGVHCAALEVEAMLCNIQENFARSEENDMQTDLLMVDEQNAKMSNMPYQKTPINPSDRILKESQTKFSKCGLSIVKMEKIENHALKQLFSLNSKRISVSHQPLYQCVKAQFCDLICRVGFQREYAPPKEQKYGAGIYFTTRVDAARSLWTDNGEEYVYFIAAQVLTGNQTRGSSEMIVPPPIGDDPLVRYDSVTNLSDIHVIFNGQQAYPEFLITCRIVELV